MKKGKPGKKYSQAARLHNIIRLIESRHGISIEELIDETDVDRRTIYRDFKAISDAGYPLTAEWVGNRKEYSFITGFKSIPPISFSLQELMTLYLLRSYLNMFEGTPFQEDISAIFNKIHSVLPPRYAAHLERISNITIPLLQGRKDYSKASEILSQLRQALIYQNSISITYRSPGTKTPRPYSGDPYTMLVYKGGLYLIVYVQQRKGIRTFAIERIESVTVHDQRFEIPEEYKPEKDFDNSFGIVNEVPLSITAKFAPEIAHTIEERIWHKNQKIKKLSDGSVELSFMAGGKIEILSWLLSYGDKVELISPVEMRRELKEIIDSMQCKYKKDR
ncbi:MAG: transcriptional regulator [Desulfuromonadales bacterium]|nr:transcriptional regulator [Desulfuromonadales bacterium]